jgi:hypothetical protein
MTEPAALTTTLPAQATDVSQRASTWSLTFDRVLAATAAVACIALVIYQLVLTRLLNVNWDEFYFLSHVHELARGELALVLQGVYTHLFLWLLWLPGNEMDQIVAARWVMVALLGLTAWLIWRLARVWLTGFAALLAPFVYLSMMGVLQHGGSFRADTMLAPLSVASLLLLVRPAANARHEWLAGVLLGVAFALTPKIVLFAPLFIVAAVLGGQGTGDSSRFAARDAVLRLVRVAVAGGIVSALLIGLHWLVISPVQADSMASVATASVRKTLFDVPWFPRSDYFTRYFSWQPFSWLMIGGGAALALMRRRFIIAALALSLLPLAFYRNAFPYYYVVMLAPASVLAAYAVAEIWTLVRSRASDVVSTALIAAIWIGFLIQGVRFATVLAFDDQVLQRQVVAAAHQIFPEPVNYIDRCGMIPSFRKVNFFMSTWGMEDYRARNEPFLARALRDRRPAFVLWNTVSLDPRNEGPYGLLREDRALLAKYYVGYWGPIRIAGAHGVLASDPLRLTVPFPALYRLETPEAVLVDGDVRADGDVVPVPPAGVVITRPTDSAKEPISVALLLSSARPAPVDEPARMPIFRGL